MEKGHCIRKRGILIKGLFLTREAKSKGWFRHFEAQKVRPDPHLPPASWVPTDMIGVLMKSKSCGGLGRLLALNGRLVDTW